MEHLAILNIVYGNGSKDLTVPKPSSGMFGHEIYQGLIICSGIFSILSNLLIIPLLLFHSKFELNYYKIVLVCSSLVNILYSLAFSFILPSFFLTHNAVVVYASGYPAKFPFIATASIIFVSDLYFLIVLVQCLQFAYRFIVLCRCELAWLLEPQNQIVNIILLILLNTAFHSLNLTYLLQVDGGVKASINDTTVEVLKIDADKIYGVASMYWTETGSPRWTDVTGVTNILLWQILCFGLMTYCGTSIVCELNSERAKSNLRKYQHHLLYKSLLTQVIFSTIFVHFPCGFLVLIPFLGVPVGKSGEYQCLTLLVYSMLDPMIVMYFVIDRRKALLDAFYPARSVTWKITPSTHTSSVQTNNSGTDHTVADSIEMTSI